MTEPNDSSLNLLKNQLGAQRPNCGKAQLRQLPPETIDTLYDYLTQQILAAPDYLRAPPGVRGLAALIINASRRD